VRRGDGRERLTGTTNQQPSDGNWHTCLVQTQAFPGSTPGTATNLLARVLYDGP